MPPFSYAPTAFGHTKKEKNVIPVCRREYKSIINITRVYSGNKREGLPDINRLALVISNRFSYQLGKPERKEKNRNNNQGNIRAKRF